MFVALSDFYYFLFRESRVCVIVCMSVRVRARLHVVHHLKANI